MKFQKHLKVKSSKFLDASHIWLKHEADVWQVENLCGETWFYPVYQYLNYYSYNPIPLILLKGRLDVDLEFINEKNFRSDLPYVATDRTIDKNIRKIGGPLSKIGRRVNDAQQFIRLVSKAMQDDIDSAEVLNPGFTNMILVGGKDSLNLLMLNWKNPTIVLSADPNYNNTVKFCQDNKIDIPVVHLMPKDITSEAILGNCCSTGLEHLRWAEHLKEMVFQEHGRVIFWQGSHGDCLLTNKWKSVRHSVHNCNFFIRNCDRLVKILGGREFCALKSMWDRSANFQGNHHSIFRWVTGALTLSAYHGKSVSHVLSLTDFHRALCQDHRSAIGERLLGRQVIYPDNNPGPPEHEPMRKLDRPEIFLSLLPVSINQK